MTAYYVDTSALVKRYGDETGRGWLRTTLGAQPSPSIIIVHLAVVEMTSATAIVANQGLVDHDLAPLSFLSSDDCLDEAVSAEGLAVDDHNHHP